MDFQPYDLLITDRLSPEQVREILAEIGFQEIETAHRRFCELAETDEGRTNLAISLPMLLHALATTANPDGSLLNFERYVQSVDSRDQLFEFLAQNPRGVEILVKLFVGSQFLTEILIKRPFSLEKLTHHRQLADFKSQQDFFNECEAELTNCPNVDEKLNAIRRYQQWELLRIGACDSFGLMDLKSVTLQLSLLADAVVQSCLKTIAEDLSISTEGFAVLAFGKLGGEELNYSSDIDLVFLANDNAGQLWTLGQRLIKAIMHPTEDGFLYRVDMRLRPWGRSGALVTSRKAYIGYLDKHAMLWEKQALLKVRGIAGDRQLIQDFLKEAEPYIYDVNPDVLRDEVLNMKQQIERNLEKKGRMWGQVKAGVGSIRDVEFTTQYLQLRHGRENKSVRSINTLDALVRLADFSLLQADEYRQLSSGYVFLRTVEHALQLMQNKQVHHLPKNQRELAYLARRLDFPDADTFLTFYERHCASIRRVFEKYLLHGGSASAEAETVPRKFSEELATYEPSYRDRFTPVEMALQEKLLAQLSLDNLIELHAAPDENGYWRLTLVGYDYVGELSVICGLLLFYGYDIKSGDVFTGEHRGGLEHSELETARSESKKKDRRRFICQLIIEPNEGVDPHETWSAYRDEMEELTRLLRQGKRRMVQGALAKRVGHAIDAVEETDDVLLPVEIEIDNESQENVTVLDIRGDDTPGFLYELSNGLLMKGIRVERITVLSVGDRVADTLYVTDQDNRKIEDPKQQNELRATVVLIKHFTHLLPQCPNPEAALLHFRDFLEQLLQQDDWPEELASLESSRVLEALAKLLGVSDFLWEDFLRLQHANLFPVLTDVDALSERRERDHMEAELLEIVADISDHQQQIEAINAFKDREMLRADLRHILGYEERFGEFSRELTNIAEVVVKTATKLCWDHLVAKHGEPLLEDGNSCGYAICALGKCGGIELGFASDIELMFLYEGKGGTTGRNSITNAEFFQKLVELFQHTLRAKRAGIFEIDLRLRPYGRAGSLAVSLESFQNYFRLGGPAWPYERQALVKMRAIAGTRRFGETVINARDELVYTGDPFDVASMRAMRERQIRQLVKAGTINAKLSPGGLVDCEYLVQGLQICYGHKHRDLRTTNTREALKALEDHGYLVSVQRVQLRDCYRFLRRLIDALRMVRGDARDLTVPSTDSEEFEFLARRLGFAKHPGELAQRLEETMTLVQEIATPLLDEVLQEDQQT